MTLQGHTKQLDGAMIRAAESWRGLAVTDVERRQPGAVKAELDAECQVPIDPTTAAPRSEAPATRRP